MKQLQGNYKRIVVKIGSSLFYRGKELDIARSFGIISDIAGLIKLQGKEVVIVSSGAIALGMELIKLNSRPKELPFLQATAAIGQNALMDNYSRYFKKYGITCAQILLTWEDFDNRQRYLNAKNTLLTLLKLGAVPIVNENDTVSTDEIKFGDNDRLCALVATLINADILIILSDVEGLLDKDKKVVRLVPEINDQIRALARPTNKKTCVGGMITKIEAAKIAVDSGIPCVIACGHTKDIISSVVKETGKEGTLFMPKKGLKAREHWIAFGSRPKGAIVVDDGARQALKNKKSLLSVGVVDAQGEFMAADIVCIKDKQGVEFARGKVRLSSKELNKVKGVRFNKEIIHRDDLVIL